MSPQSSIRQRNTLRSSSSGEAGTPGGGSIPPNVLRDHNNQPLLDHNDEYILEAE